MNAPSPQPLPYGHGKPTASGRIRTRVEDFRVTEQLGFAPSGSGEHVFVRVRKREANTQWVAKQISRFADVKPLAVGYAGLKDRWAVAEQWFSVQLPGRRNPDWRQFNVPGCELLASHRHDRKLRRGALRGNDFELIIRDFQGDPSEFEQRFGRLLEHGVPNYFGPQRFGHAGANLDRAAAWFAGTWQPKRGQRGMILSAARSYVFNRVLTDRVLAEQWNRPLPGDALVLERRGSFFLAEEITQEIEQRVANGALHPSGPLWGRGELPTAGAARELEQAAVADLPDWCTALAAAGLDQQRRALRVRPEGTDYEWVDATTLRIQFSLPAGAYATVVLRELMEITDTRLSFGSTV